MAPVDSTLSARLASLFDKSTGKTQAALARYCGVSTSAVNQWTKSGKIFDSNLRKVAEFFGVSQRWLQTGEGEKTAQVLSYGVGDKIPDGFVAIPEYRLEFSAGSGSEPTWELRHDSEDCWYRESFFQKRHLLPSQCKRAKVCGNSMEPELQNGDTILFESFTETRPGCVHISDGGIYVLTIDGEYRIKYLSKIKNGLLVSSENSAYRPEEYVGDECDRLKILGRVLEVNRSL